MWFSVVCILIDNETQTVVQICCETIDLFMHVDISKIFTGIGHFTVLSYLAMNASEAGVDLALIQTSLLFLVS